MSQAKKDIEDVLDTFQAVGLEMVGEYVNAKQNIETKHWDCGHTRLISYSTASKAAKIGRQIVCRECTGVRARRTHQDINEELLRRYNAQLVSPFVKVKSKAVIHALQCGHEFEVDLEKTLYRGFKCPECTKPIKAKFFSLLIDNDIEMLEEYPGALTSGKVKYSCGHEASLIPGNTTQRGSGLICRECNPLGRSTCKAQDEIIDIIKKVYSGEVIKNDRQVLDGKEIDIWIPEKNLGIEYHGMYWHSDKFISDKAHLEKANLAAKKGIKLIQVFEHEWLTKKEIVTSRILDNFGESYRLYARQCIVKRIDFPTVFLEENHLQGAGAKGSIAYGLFFKDELVSVMTFGVPRFNHNYDYELIRFCTLLDVKVVGGASKLLSAFRKEYSGTVLSYADRRYSTGKVYETLGFKYSHTSTPNYKYYKAKHILSRYQCQKHKLEALFPEHFKPELSETEIMRNAGYNKVYDAGNLVYTL